MAMFFRKNFGWLTILALCLIPIIRWYYLLPLGVRFFDLNMTMTSLGQITGLLGMSLFSINLILAGRFRYLDKYFHGLNLAYDWHRTVGTLAFSLLLFHPLFLAFKNLSISTRAAALFLLPGDNLAITYGIVALAWLVILISITFYAKIKYQHWKISHKFMVAVFVFAVLHAWLIPSDISRDPLLRFYLLGLADLGLAIGFYQAFVSRYLNLNYIYEIKKLNWPSPEVIDVEMAAKNKMLDFKSGQFIFVRFLKSRVSGESHPFSISSSPASANLNLTIKALGDYTSELKDLRVGDLASVEGPFGAFSYEQAISKDQIWLAGGVGIKPFLSMARDPKNENYIVDLYYAVKDQTEAVYLDELRQLSSANKNLKVTPWYSTERGRINAQAISQLSSGLEAKDIFICGPLPFMESLVKQLKDLGVKRNKIHWEKFNFI